SADAVCNVLFMCGLLVFAAGLPAPTLRRACAAGVLLGIAPQFRPNLLLFPVALAALVSIWRRRVPGMFQYIATFLAVVVIVNVPWTLRNYRLTGLFLPTSTHGAIQ